MPNQVHLVNVRVADKPGMLAAVTGALADGNINVDAFSADPAGIHLVTRDPEAAIAAILKAGFKATTEPVQQIILEDRPGALANICRALADAGINIPSAFGMAAGFAARIFIRVGDMPRAAPILERANAGPVGPTKRLR